MPLVRQPHSRLLSITCLSFYRYLFDNLPRNKLHDLTRDHPIIFHTRSMHDNPSILVDGQFLRNTEARWSDPSGLFNKYSESLSAMSGFFWPLHVIVSAHYLSTVSQLARVFCSDMLCAMQTRCWRLYQTSSACHIDVTLSNCSCRRFVDFFLSLERKLRNLVLKWKNSNLI